MQYFSLHINGGKGKSLIHFKRNWCSARFRIGFLLHLVPPATSSVTMSTHLLWADFLFIKIIDWNIRLQRAPTYNEQFFLHLFTRCKHDSVHCAGSLWEYCLPKTRINLPSKEALGLQCYCVCLGLWVRIILEALSPVILLQIDLSDHWPGFSPDLDRWMQGWVDGTDWWWYPFPDQRIQSVCHRHIL